MPLVEGCHSLDVPTWLPEVGPPSQQHCMRGCVLSARCFAGQVAECAHAYRAQLSFGQRLLGGLCCGGANPRLRTDLEDVIFSAEGRHRLRTRAGGSLALQLTVVRQDYIDAVEPPLEWPQQQQGA